MIDGLRISNIGNNDAPECSLKHQLRCRNYVCSSEGYHHQLDLIDGLRISSIGDNECVCPSEGYHHQLDMIDGLRISNIGDNE